MKKWSFYLITVSNGFKYKLKHDIDEWKNFGISYGRETKTTIIKSFSANFTFVKEDAAYLREFVFKNGFNERIKIEIYTVRGFGNEVIEYTGYLDMSDPEISGNTFKCPIYSGGFFTALDNAWNDEYDIRAYEEVADVQYNDYFKNFNFTGGEYELEEQLGLLDEKQNFGDVRIDLKTLFSDPFTRNFLPIKKIYNRDSKLQFFNNAKQLATNGFDVNVSKEQCFIISPNKNNEGKLFFNLSGSIGDIEVTVPYEPLSGTGIFYTGKIINNGYSHIIKGGVHIYIYNDAGVDKWRDSDNVIYSEYKLLNANLIGDVIEIDSTNKKLKLLLKDFNIGNFVFPIILGNQYMNTGYFVAVQLEIQQFDITYLYRPPTGSSSIITENIFIAPCTFIPNKNFTITYKNENFALNKNRIVHGIYHTDLFKCLIDKINTTYKVKKTLPPTLSESYRYKINVVTSNLDAWDFYIIASGTTLLGSKEDVKEAGIQSGIRTSLKSFVEYMYKVHAHKLICTYDKNNDTYNLKFISLRSCYQNAIIQKLDNVSDLIITSDRDNLYTSIKVGYSNTNDSIFGLLEYNTTNIFKTGNTELEHKELDLVSPYKAGVFDIETFVHDKYNNYEDTQDGSGEIYIIDMDMSRITETSNILNRKPNLVNIPNNKIKIAFNHLITPKRILMKHDNELSSYLFYTRILKFISSERNVNFSYFGIIEGSDETLSGNNYTLPFIAEIKVPAVMDIINKIDTNPLGYFQFEYNGKIYKGYIAEGTDSITVNPMNETSSNIKLILAKDSAL